jgi:hypothetical protein
MTDGFRRVEAVVPVIERFVVPVRICLGDLHKESPHDSMSASSVSGAIFFA